MKTVLKLLKKVVTLTVVVGLGYGGWLYYQSVNAVDEEQGLGEVPTQAAEVRDITVSVSATGSLRPVRIVQVKSKASGEIINMPVDLGDRVRSGDLIAQVDTETLEQELAQAQADLDSAKIRLDVTDRQYQRALALQKQDLVSFQDLDTSEQNYTQARGQHLRAEAELKLRQERLDDATVTASADGTIILKNVEEGTIIQSSTSSVQGGTTLVEMADLSTLEVRTLVDEIDIGRVRPGMRVNITVEAFPERLFQGEVVKIEPMAVVQQQVTTFPVLSIVDNADGLLLPGMNADVEVIIHRSPRVITVPNEAVKTISDASTVASLLGLPFDRQALAEGRPSMAANADAGGRGTAMAAEATPADRGQAAPAGDAAEGEIAEGDDAEDGEEEEVDFSKMRGMSATERREFMANLTDKQRASLRERFSGAGQGGGRPGGGATGGGQTGGFGGGQAGGASGGGDDADAGNTTSMDAFGIGRRQAAIVFVINPTTKQFVARQVTMGVQDWEYTEIVAGLEPGDEVVLLPSTSLLQSQQALRDRFSSFSSPIGGGRGRR